MDKKTNVIGYFNPNEYPLQLSLAEHNMVLQLQPKAYVVDRSGRLVNDPALDRFVGKGRLARASDQKQQVELTLLRAVNDTTSSQPATHQHSVSQAAGFTTQNGRVVAVSPQSTAPQPATPPPASYNPVKGYTVEEAKRRHLIKPTKLVPEDYGADETNGAPKSGESIPTIKYATDTVRGRKPAPLPAELVTPATPQQAAIISSLERAATASPDDPNVLTSVARTVVAESTVTPVTALPKPVLDAAPPLPPQPAAPARLTPPPIPVNPAPTEVVTLPAPTVDEGESSLVVEDELPQTQESGTTVPETNLAEEDRVDAARRGSAPPPPTGVFKCPICPNKSFREKGMFLRHVRRFHEDKEQELMAPYGGA